jgi:uncharacterized RDD family membrane protein YckC
MSAVQHDLLEIRTAENVGVGYDIAGLGSRILAFLLDLVVVSLILLVMELFLIALLPDGGAGAGLISVGVAFFSITGYFVIAEATSAGRTPGKRALSLRVVRGDGGAPGAPEAVVRTLVRYVDLLFGIGLFFMFFDVRYRRLGDFAAGTVVVRERRAQALPPPPTALLLRTPDAGPAIDGLDALGAREAGALRTFLTRPGLSPEQRTRIAAQLAARLLDRLGLPANAPERQWPPELFVERLYLQLSARSGPGAGEL